MESTSSWSELPEDLLRIVIAGLTDPADCARFRAVCRSWRSIPSPRRWPWMVLPPLPKTLTEFYAEYTSFRVVSFPHNVRCVGSTDSWLAIDTVDDAEKSRAFSLQNIFSKEVVPLPELDAIIGNIPEPFQVRKVLMRSPPTGLVAVGTNSRKYPIILVQPGKGAWSPEPQEAVPLARIIDIAFLGDKLYGITMSEDLISLSIAIDSQGTPTVTGIEHVIRHQIGDDDVDFTYDGIEAENTDVEEDEVDNDEALGEEGEEEYLIGDDDPNMWTDAVDLFGYGGDDENTRTGNKREEAPDGMYVLDGVHFSFVDNDTNKDFIATIWYLVESCGKLLMARRKMKDLHLLSSFTCELEVFEADATASMWVPVLGGLDGQALFISKRFSKSVMAGGDIEKDAIHFIDSGEVFNMRSKTTTAPNIAFNFGASWLFLPGSF